MPQVFLNELSCQGYVSSDDIESSISELVACLKELKKRNVSCVYTHLRLDEIKITQTLNINSLVSSRTYIDDDMRNIVLGFFSVSYPIQMHIDDAMVIGGYVNNKNALGLTIASDAVKKEFALSFSNTGWDNDLYQINITRLNEQGDTLQSTATARNITCTDHFDIHKNYLPLPPEIVPNNGKFLSIMLPELFPNLVFSSLANKYLKGCTSGETVRQIYTKLKELQDVAINLDMRSFDPDMFKSLASPESETRDRMAELDIQFNDGIVRHCSWHLRYTPGAGRIHFSNDKGKENTIYVGYIGEKINP